MINYNKNLFAILIIYLMRIAAINCQHFPTTSGSSLRPIWKFSSFFENNVQYQCYQKCFPVVQPQPQMLVDLCTKICPFKPTIPECVKCPHVLSQIVPVMTIADIHKRLDTAEPEIIVIEPQSHAIFFKPEVVVAGQERKQCCYMDQCETVPLHAKCESRCYEPCDAVCTGRCRLNPQCPNQCEVVRQQLYRMQYKMWLANKLNEIKIKYRAMATACLLRTRLEFVQEVQGLHGQTPTFLGGEFSLQGEMPQAGPIQVITQLQDEDDEGSNETPEMKDEEGENKKETPQMQRSVSQATSNDDHQYDDEYDNDAHYDNYANNDYFNPNDGK